MSVSRIARFIVAATAASFFTLPGHAAPVQLCGATICYEYDNDAAANPDLALLGAPTLFGTSNVLKFTPTTLNVFTSGAGGATEASWSFQFSRVWSPQGLTVGPLNLLVAGDYQIPVGGAVRGDFGLRAEGAVADGGQTGFPEAVDWAGSFSASEATGLPFRNWDLAGSIDPSATFTDPASSVRLTIHGRLAVLAGGPEDSALIAQKLGLLVGAPVVPAPGAGWLMITGLGALVHRARRKARR